jgi:DNA-binding transcriptional ArsR family regulator/DNA-directed RNA polymerase subunit RPC12/RpoP
MDSPVTHVDLQEISPDDAFAILGNETRMETLRVLWKRDEACSFTELCNAVAPDSKGNYNYHLEKLTDHFVRKTEEGYVLRYAGEQVVRAVLTGTITSDPTIPKATTDERCLFCGAHVEMQYDEETILVQCPECGGVIEGEFPNGTNMSYPFPPAGLVGRDPEEMIDAAHILYDTKIAPMMKGICPECAAKIEIEIDVCPDHARDDSGICRQCESRYEVWTVHECINCQYARQFPPWYAALNHPAAVAFLYDHGIEEKVPFRKITWDNQQFMRDISETVVAKDPYRFEVTIPIEDELLQMTLDERLNAVSVARFDCEK